VSHMILYHGEPNGPSLAVLAALFETGLEVELRHIDLLAGERHTIPGLTAPLARDLGVEGEGPVLVIDGEAMTESVFIAQYLDEAAGGVGLQPSDAFAHWEMLMWCRRVTERSAPAIALLGGKVGVKVRLAAMTDSAFAGITDRIVSEDLRQRWIDYRRGDFADAAIADSVTKLGDIVAAVEAQLQDGRAWLMCAFSIADLETFCWWPGMVDLYPDIFADKPLARAWIERVRSRPSVQRALALATVADPGKSWAPGPEINRWG
jgi:GSH-dependent disulfide-bond oxidoreductase